MTPQRSDATLYWNRCGSPVAYILREYPEIEKKHFKLWFSSITILDCIFNNAIEGRTKSYLEAVKRKIPLYVLTHKLDDALKILAKEKLLLITGQPGVGKTTLADILLFEKANSGFKIYKVENIREAEDVMSADLDTKQLFYYDDFLGSNYFEITSPNRTESQLTSFVERVKNTPNKYLILTTRTVILNHASEKYEKIGHSRIANQQFELKLADYTKIEKARILYNHLFFHQVNEELYNSILNEKFYRIIIQHKNYTPRIVEFVTDKAKINSFNSNTYHQFIKNNLDNPEEIWRHSFNNQIEYLDRCLLLTLFSFPGAISEKPLLIAYESRLKFERSEHNQIIGSNQFNQSIRILLNGFVSSTIVNRQIERREYSFINPSLTDFLISYISNSFQERKSIVASIKYIEQLYKFDPNKAIIPFEKDLQIILYNKISKCELGLINESSEFYTQTLYGTFLEVLVKYCRDIDIDSLLIEFIEKIDFSEKCFWVISRQIQYLLTNLENAPLTANYIKLKFNNIIKGLITSITRIEDAEKIPEIFVKYEQDYNKYTDEEEGTELLLELIDSILSNYEDYLINERKDTIIRIDHVEDLYDELIEIQRCLEKKLFPKSNILTGFTLNADYNYWEEKIKENIERSLVEEIEAERYIEDNKIETNNRRSEDEAIDDLFYKTK